MCIQGVSANQTTNLTYMCVYKVCLCIHEDLSVCAYRVCVHLRQHMIQVCVYIGFVCVCITTKVCVNIGCV